MNCRLARHGFALTRSVAGATLGTLVGAALSMGNPLTNPTISILAESLRWTLSDLDEA